MKECEEALLRVEHIRVAYKEIQVLRDISLQIFPGEIVTLIGANAAGKTTLISCISRILQDFQGSIHFRGTEISRKKPEEIVDMGLIQCPEGRLLFPELTVQENLNLGAFSKRCRHTRKERLEMVFEFLPKLKEKAGQYAGSLSGGEAQMCAIGRSLMADPLLLMLDEPSIGLAPQVVQEIMVMLRELNRQGMTIFLVEQNVRQSLKLCHRAYVLENGKIVLEGTGDALLQSGQVRQAYLGI